MGMHAIPERHFLTMHFYLDILTTLLFQKYYTDSRCLIVFNDNKHAMSHYDHNIQTVQINVENYKIHPEIFMNYFGCQDILVQTKNPLTVFKRFESEIRLGMERWNKRRYLFIPVENATENVTDIYDSTEIEYVADLLEIEEKSIDHARSFMMYTHKYVGNNKRNKRVLLDIWFANNQTFKYNSHLFPNKLKNQHGRQLRMATFQYEPYSIVGATVDQFKGSEMSTAVMFAKKNNMKPVPVVNPEDYWGEAFSNWTGNGLLGNLISDNADVGFGALYTWEVDYHYLDLSKPLVRTGITCLVPAPKLAPGWLTPVYSYSSTMWLSVGSMFGVCILSLLFMNFSNITKEKYRARRTIGDIFKSSIFTTTKLFVQQSLTNYEIPLGVSGRLFMGLIFILTLFLTSSYSSGLASIMTIPRYENPIDTVMDLYKSGLYWGATQDAWITSIQNAEDEMYKEIVRRFRPTPEETLREYSKSDSFAFSIERLPNDNFAIGSYIQNDVIGNFHLMVEDIYWEQCIMMTRKNSVLLPLLDEFILRVFETGLISYWQNEATNLFMNPDVQKAVKFYNSHHNTKHTIVKLSWTHVEGAFGILCLGHSLSTMVFIIELLIKHSKNN